MINFSKFLEIDGVLYKVTGEDIFSQIIEKSEIEELQPDDIDDVQMAGNLTESNEDDGASR